MSYAMELRAQEIADLRQQLAAAEAAETKQGQAYEKELFAIIAERDRAVKDAERLREALEFLMRTQWKSAEKDNMEFVGRVTCYQLEKAREAIATAESP